MTEKNAPAKPLPSMPAQKADARVLAHAMLLALLEKNLSLDEVWDNEKGLGQLEGRDRAFCRLLLLTTLRYFGFLDYRLGQYAKALQNLPADVQMALRLGAAQLLILKSAAHAAVGTSVDLVFAKHKPLRGLVNAVLRKIAQEKPKAVPADHWRHIFPSWLLQNWTQHYGEASCEALARADLQEPMLDISVKETPEPWQERLGAAAPIPGVLRLPHQDEITKLPGFAEGAWWVQDIAASLPVRLLGAVKNQTVLDLCAAPGGKTAQLAAAGAKVTAVDLSPQRLTRLKENLQRLKLDAQIIASDVLNFKPTTLFDAVLLDAPCTATGTLRRHPDLLFRKKPDDITRLAQLQGRLLAKAASFLKPGGRLVYAVCSLQPEEGEGVIATFLKENPSWRREDVTVDELFGHAEWVTERGDLRTLPCHLGPEGGMDGFFAARLIKRT